MDEKFCKFCGEKIPADAVICTKCGRQVEEIKSAQAAQPQIVINNSNTNSNVNNNAGVPGMRQKNKWVHFCSVSFWEELEHTVSMKEKSELVFCGYVPVVYSLSVGLLTS